jgi:hypothetical protein
VAAQSCNFIDNTFSSSRSRISEEDKLFVAELTGTVYKHTTFSSFHQYPSPPEDGRTDQRHAVCPRVLVGPCQSAELLHQGASLRRRLLLDYLVRYVSFLL